MVVAVVRKRLLVDPVRSGRGQAKVYNITTVKMAEINSKTVVYAQLKNKVFLTGTLNVLKRINKD